MPNTILEHKRKAGDFEDVVSSDGCANFTAPNRSTNSSEGRQTRLLKVYNGLCKRCARLDLNNISVGPRKNAWGELVASLGPVSALSIDSCSFCSLTFSMLPPSYLQPGAKVSLSSYSSKWISDLGWNSIDQVLLQIRGTDEYIVSQRVEAEGPIRILKQDYIDFDILKRWISVCQDWHTKTCAFEAPSPVPFLRLIDCHTRRIIPASNNPYIALSYVWGQIPFLNNLFLEFLPKGQPHTIEDSITVTLKLGFRYLWIDRYCINQQLQEEVKEQVKRMDLIYQNAQVTIIACAGEDPTYGLPGIGYRKRHPQACETVGKHLMISALCDPRESIENSTWRTRAWTLQEALLSKRRLVFTDHQVYYECYGMYCCEAMDFPLPELHTKNRQRFKKNVCQGEDIGVFPKGVGSGPWEVVERIEEYSRLGLNLTNPTDILKGILGILNAFERSTLNIHHYEGVPILPSCPKIVEFPSDNWPSVKGFFIGLCWTSEKSSFRRVGFPSWSWAGWNAPVKWGYDKYNWPYIRVDNNIEVEVELADRQILDLETFYALRDMPESAPVSTNFIHISAWTSTLRIMRRESWNRPDEYDAKIKLEDGGYIYWRFKSTTNIPFLPNQFATGIHLTHEAGTIGDGKLTPEGPDLLVVCQVDGGMTERIGFGRVDHYNYAGYDNKGDPIKMESLFDHRDELPAFRLVRSWQKIRLG